MDLQKPCFENMMSKGQNAGKPFSDNIFYLSETHTFLVCKRFEFC